MNILITGNQRYIGTALTKLLLEKGYKLFPASKVSLEKIANMRTYERRLDYSGMDDFVKVFYTRYLRDFDF